MLVSAPFLAAAQVRTGHGAGKPTAKIIQVSQPLLAHCFRWLIPVVAEIIFVYASSWHIRACSPWQACCDWQADYSSAANSERQSSAPLP